MRERILLKCGDPIRVSRKTPLVPGIMAFIFVSVSLCLLIDSYANFTVNLGVFRVKFRVSEENLSPDTEFLEGMRLGLVD